MVKDVSPFTGLTDFFDAATNRVGHGLDLNKHKNKELLIRFAETKDITQLDDIFPFSTFFLTLAKLQFKVQSTSLSRGTKDQIRLTAASHVVVLTRGKLIISHESIHFFT